MSNQPVPAALAARQFKLQFPTSLAKYDEYAAAQRTVDYLSDQEFPVQNLMIVGTELKQFERVTGRLTTPRVALSGALSGAWFGLFIGLLISFFTEGSAWEQIFVAMAVGAGFGVIWAMAGYLASRGQRDFASITTVAPTQYEVLVEHKVATQARELLAGLPGALPNPFE